jgi:hypothetical protein
MWLSEKLSYLFLRIRSTGAHRNVSPSDYTASYTKNYTFACTCGNCANHHHQHHYSPLYTNKLEGGGGGRRWALNPHKCGVSTGLAKRLRVTSSRDLCSCQHRCDGGARIRMCHFEVCAPATWVGALMCASNILALF